MMHYEEVICTLTDSNNKPFREFEAKRLEKGRKCKVFIPFSTEYKLLCKNQTDRRIKLEIEIDGTIVSGGGLILSAHTNEYIERFVDVAKKFKFVKLSNDAVGDPTSKENGLIKIRVSKEKKSINGNLLNGFYKKIIEEHHHHHHYDHWWPYNGNPWQPNTPIWYSNANNPIGSVGGNLDLGDITCSTSEGKGLNDVHTSYSSSSCSKSSDSPVGDFSQVNYCQRVGPVIPIEPGATVEGGDSQQTFKSTDWAGDDEISWFTFEVSGLDLAKDPEYQKYLELKNKFEG